MELFDGEVTLIGGAHDVDYPDIYRGLNLMTDTYYIKVYAVLGTGSFTLNIAEFVPIPIGLGDTVGPITAPDESIWYNISLAAGDYQFSLSGPEGTNFDLFLYNSNLGYISTSVNPEYPDIYRGYSLIVDNYFIEIYASNGTGTFTLTVSEYTRVLNIISPVQQSYATNTIPVHFDGNAIHYWYFIEGIDAQNQTWTASTDRIIPDGSYTLHAYGNDTFNTILHVPVTFSVDTTPPVINIISPLNLTYTDQIITISYTVSDGEVTIFLPPNNTPNNTNIPSGYTTPFPDGLNYNITIEAVDHVGNIARSTVIFSVGAGPPSISIDSPLVSTYTDSITITLSGSVDYFWYYIEGIDTSNQTWTITTMRSLPSGTYTLHAYGNNSVGVEVSESVTFTVDLPTTTTTTKTTTTPSSTTTTTTKPKSGEFPSIPILLLFMISLVIKKKKTQRK